MINSDFYPTPSSLVYKMIEWLDLKESIILEPSAWKWDILDIVKNRMWNNSKQRLYAIEIEEDLQTILKWKGYKVIDSDFLKYDWDIDFNLIIANFPFSNWDEHFLKSWEIMKNWAIVCLLNAETIKNPYSEKRKLINRIIEDNNGTVEYIQNAFTTAERKTGVEVALIKINKITETIDFEFDWMKDREYININEEFKNNWLQTQDLIQNIIQDYQTAKELYSKGLQYIEQATKIASSISDNYELKPFDIAKNCNTNKARVLEYTEKFKYWIWNKIIKAIGAERFMTSKVRDDFNKFMREQGNIALTKNNIEIFLQNLMKKSGSIMDSTILEVFDYFTKYHKENRIYIEGWKTNDSWKVNRKVILPRIVNNNFALKYYTYDNWLNDIEKVMCYLSWKVFDWIKTIKDWISENKPWEQFDTEFFTCRFYKKWTLHIYFKCEKLWQDFTMKAVYWKGWLPPWEKKKYEESFKSLIKIIWKN